MKKFKRQQTAIGKVAELSCFSSSCCTREPLKAQKLIPIFTHAKRHCRSSNHLRHLRKTDKYIKSRNVKFFCKEEIIKEIKVSSCLAYYLLNSRFRSCCKKNSLPFFCFQFNDRGQGKKPFRLFFLWRPARL